MESWQFAGVKRDVKLGGVYIEGGGGARGAELANLKVWGRGLDWGWIVVLLWVFSCRELLFYKKKSAVARLQWGCKGGTDYLSMVGTVLGPSTQPMQRDHHMQLQHGCQENGVWRRAEPPPGLPTQTGPGSRPRQQGLSRYVRGGLPVLAGGGDACVTSGDVAWAFLRTRCRRRLQWAGDGGGPALRTPPGQALQDARCRSCRWPQWTGGGGEGKARPCCRTTTAGAAGRSGGRACGGGEGGAAAAAAAPGRGWGDRRRATLLAGAQPPLNAAGQSASYEICSLRIWKLKIWIYQRICSVICRICSIICRICSIMCSILN